MVAIEFVHSLRFLHQVFVDVHPVPQLDAMIGPARPFGLQVEPYEVGGFESSRGWAERMEAHVIQSIAAANAEHTFPRRHIHGRITGEREIAILHCTAQLGNPAVHVEHFTFDLELPHAEGAGLCVGAVGSGDGSSQTIERRTEFIPQLHVVAHVQRHFHLCLSLFQLHGACHGRHIVRVFRVETLGGKGDFCLRPPLGLMLLQDKPHGGGFLVNVGIHLYVVSINQRSALQFHAANDSVPVALRLVGHTMRIRPDANAINLVVDAECQCVLSRLDGIGQIIAVRNAQAVVASYLFPVHPQFGLNMRTLEEEHHAALLPIGRHVDGLLVPSRPDIMPVGSEEKRQFEVPGLTVFLHVRIIKVGTVVERTGPLRLHGRQVALQSLGHASRQQDMVFQLTVIPFFRSACVSAVCLELPRARQVEHVLRHEVCRGNAGKQHERGG